MTAKEFIQYIIETVALILFATVVFIYFVIFS